MALLTKQTTTIRTIKNGHTVIDGAIISINPSLGGVDLVIGADFNNGSACYLTADGLTELIQELTAVRDVLEAGE